MMPKGLFLLGAAFMALTQAGRGQPAPNWRVYKAADGLAESACLSVAITPQGDLLVKHLTLASISELDGYAVSVIPAPEQAASRVYESPGGQLWTVVPEGLQEFRQGAWVLHPVPEIAAEFRARLVSLVNGIPLCPVRQGLVLCLLPDLLLEFNQEGQEPERTKVLRTASQTRLGRFAAMTLARAGGLWVTGAQGLAKVPGPL